MKTTHENTGSAWMLLYKIVVNGYSGNFQNDNFRSASDENLVKMFPFQFIIKVATSGTSMQWRNVDVILEFRPRLHCKLSKRQISLQPAHQNDNILGWVLH